MKCIDSVYFIVGFVLEWIYCDRDRQRLLNWCHCVSRKQWRRVYVFVDIMLFTKENRMLLKF